MRAALLIERGIRPASQDLRGVLFDVLAAVVLTLVIAAVARRGRWVVWVVLPFWTLLAHANYEHVKALEGVVGLQHLHYLWNWTFFRGSALALSRPLLPAAVLAGSLLLGWLALRGGEARFRLRPFAIAALVLWVAGLVWPLDPGTLPWRQVNVVHENLRALVRPTLPHAGTGSDAPVGPGARAAGAELDGDPLVPLGHPRHNVLLIMLESVSGAHLEPVAAPLGIRPVIRMERLGRIVERGLLFPDFIAQQRQTNRGEYAILCGDYPGLITGPPKMSEYVVSGGVRCLPAALRDAGHETVYLQAAPLGFMLKDQFMSRIGFARVHGEEWFGTSYARNQWGVDDRAFFEQSLDMVRELRQGDRPWFLALLNVGTHHPGVVPDDFDSGHAVGTPGRAMEYLDRAFAPFVPELNRMGVLQDTLVLITSDESMGIRRGTDDVTKMLSQNWSFLAALLPSGERRIVDGPYAQMDLALSVLDYLGYPEEAARFGGRSVFRSYDTGRPLAFGNTFLGTVGGLDGAGGLVLCRESFEECMRFELTERGPFDPQRRRVPVGPEDAEFLRRIARASGASAGPARTSGRYALLGRGAVPLLDRATAVAGEPQLLMAGQSIAVGAGARVEVDLRVRITGGPGRLKLEHDLVQLDERLFAREFPELDSGDRVTIRYAYTPHAPLHALECRLWATRLEGTGMRLEFERAELALGPATAAPGIAVHDVGVEKGAKQDRTGRDTRGDNGPVPGSAPTRDFGLGDRP